MSARRVLMVAPTPFFADRGCHVRILEEVRALRALGHEVALCTYHHGRTPAGLDVRRSTRVPWYRRLSAGPSVHKPYLDALLLATTLRAGRGFRPDVLHAHLHEGAAVGWVARWILRTPLVVDLQGSLTGELLDHDFIRSGWAQALFRRLEGWLDRIGDAVVVSTARGGAQARALGVDPGRLHLVPDGIDVEAHAMLAPEARREARRLWNLDPDRPLVVFTGVLAPYQGIEFLLQAAASLGTAPGAPQFAIAGYPEEPYRQEAARRGLANVTFLGRVPYEQMPSLLALADVAVSPKRSATEGNLKLYAYMAAGLPVVVFDDETNREILGAAGTFVEPGNGLAFTAELARLLANPARREELGQALRARARAEASWHARAVSLTEVYDRLAGSPRRARPAERAEPARRRGGGAR